MSGRLNSASMVGIFLLVFGLLAAWYGFRIEPDMDGGVGARVFPLLASGAIALMGALELRRGQTGDDTPLALSNSPASIIRLLALCIAYLFLMAKLGYLLSTAFAAPLAMWLFGMRSPLWLLVTAIICPAIYHLIFFVLLGVFPPFGEWFDLLDVLQGY